VQAEIIKNALEAEGMRCFLEQEDQGGWAGLMNISVKVQVPAADAERARRFIRDHEGSHSEEEPEDEGPDLGTDTETGIREGL
jgi:hypothetical protein